MLKRIIILVAIATSLSAVAFAQIARNPSRNLEGKSNFSNIGVVGLDATGNPGYIELTGHDAFGVVTTYYVWVDSTGDMRIASYSSISAMASFPTGDWSIPAFNAGVVVGGQS